MSFDIVAGSAVLVEESEDDHTNRKRLHQPRINRGHRISGLCLFRCDLSSYPLPPHSISWRSHPCLTLCTSCCVLYVSYSPRCVLSLRLSSLVLPFCLPPSRLPSPLFAPAARRLVPCRPRVVRCASPPLVCSPRAACRRVSPVSLALLAPLLRVCLRSVPRLRASAPLRAAVSRPRSPRRPASRSLLAARAPACPRRLRAVRPPPLAASCPSPAVSPAFPRASLSAPPLAGPVSSCSSSRALSPFSRVLPSLRSCAPLPRPLARAPPQPADNKSASTSATKSLPAVTPPSLCAPLRRLSRSSASGSFSLLAFSSPLAPLAFRSPSPLVPASLFPSAGSRPTEPYTITILSSQCARLRCFSAAPRLRLRPPPLVSFAPFALLPLLQTTPPATQSKLSSPLRLLFSSYKTSFVSSLSSFSFFFFFFFFSFFFFFQHNPAMHL